MEREKKILKKLMVIYIQKGLENTKYFNTNTHKGEGRRS